MNRLSIVAAFVVLVIVKGVVGESAWGMAVFFASLFAAMHLVFGLRSWANVAVGATTSTILYLLYVRLWAPGVAQESFILMLSLVILLAAILVSVLRRNRHERA